MTIKKTIITLTLAAFAFSAALATERPNIVYIVVDNVTFEHMGKAYGGETVTPAMDAIAERGVRFERMYVPTPLCIPSRYSILTGRYPERCTAEHYLASNPAGQTFYDVSSVELEPGRPNLPSVLGAAGYRTGYVGKFHLYHGKLGPDLAPKQKTHISDPEITRIMREKNDALVDHIKTCGFGWVGGAEAGNGYPVVSEYRKNLDNEGAKHNLEWEIDNALEFIDESAKGDEPFFLYLATQMYHLMVDLDKNLLSDYERVGRYTERGLLDKAPKVPMPSRRDIVAEAQKLRPPDSQKKPKLVFLGSGHDAEFMLWLDYGVKALLDRLDSLGLAENTIVVFISDNNQAGKSTVFEGGIRVPASMMWPGGIPAGQVNRHIVSSLDIAATLLDAAGAVAPPEMQLDGNSFLPMVQGEGQEWDDVFMAEYGYMRGIVTPRWKYVTLRYPPDIQAKIAEEDARNPQEPDFGNRKGPRRVWELFVQDNLQESHFPAVLNYYRWAYREDGNYISKIPLYPHILDEDQLYDLNTDPGEQNNLAGNPEFVPVLREMKKKMKTETRKLDRPYGEFNNQRK